MFQSSIIWLDSKWILQHLSDTKSQGFLELFFISGGQWCKGDCARKRVVRRNTNTRPCSWAKETAVRGLIGSGRPLVIGFSWNPLKACCLVTESVGLWNVQNWENNSYYNQLRSGWCEVDLEGLALWTRIVTETHGNLVNEFFTHRTKLNFNFNFFSYHLKFFI